MPKVGYGCWKVPKDVIADCIYTAIKSGYRLIDEACDYGNEQECGQGIKKAIDEGLVKREDLFVTSKLWNTYHRKENVKAACKKSMSDLGVEYLDLYVIHFPVALKFVPFEHRYPPEWVYDPNCESPKMEPDSVSYIETYQAMEELVAEGLVKNIGVSNVGTVMLRDVLAYAKVKPTVLQVEMHPFLSQEKLLRFAKENDVAVTAYSSFGGGSYVEIGLGDENDAIFNNPLIIGLAEDYGKSAGQIALKWAIQRGTAVIPKSTKAERIAENINIFDFVLKQRDFERINTLNKNKRFNDPGAYCERFFN